MAAALTIDDFRALWASSIVDDGYSQPMLEQGEGSGIEAHEQAMAQFARTSTAIDRTMQALYILPWSGQTSDPASGAAKARVTLTLTRSLAFERTLLFAAGDIFIEEEQVDAGEDGGIEIPTGRRFTLLVDVVFLPGEAGPFDVEAEAEKTGFGYNNPAPGTIALIQQPGSGFTNNRASVVTSSAGGVDQLRAANKADTIIPDHVGQYVLLGGVNDRRVRRVAGYGPPDLTVTPAIGGIAFLDPVASYEGVIGGGDFVPGEVCTQATTLAKGIVLRAASVSGGADRIAIRRTEGAFSSSDVFTGDISGASFTPATMLEDAALADDAGGATWVVLDWVSQLGVAITHVESPAGGLLASLDQLGKERNVFRAPGEDDAGYRKRVSTIADVVSPNAIRRAANRVYSPYGRSACLREVGSLKLPGFYFDAPDPWIYPWDLDAYICRPSLTGTPILDERVVQKDLLGKTYAIGYYVGAFGGRVNLVCTYGAFVDGIELHFLLSGAKQANPFFAVKGVRPQDRNKVVLDYTEFRAFFEIGAPAIQLGDFGFFWDANYQTPAYDIPPYLAFFDGFPVSSAILLRSTWQAVEETRAGGVTWILYEERIGCD